MSFYASGQIRKQFEYCVIHRIGFFNSQNSSHEEDFFVCLNLHFECCCFSIRMQSTLLTGQDRTGNATGGVASSRAEIIHKSLSYLRPYKLLLAKFSSIAVRLALPREDLDI